MNLRSPGYDVAEFARSVADLELPDIRGAILVELYGLRDQAEAHTGEFLAQARDLFSRLGS